MKHDARIDILLSEITNGVLDELCIDIMDYSFDPLRIDGGRPLSANDNFFAQVEREHPASFRRAVEDNDPKSLILHFHSMAGACTDAAKYTVEKAYDRDIDVGIFATQAFAQPSYSHKVAVVRLTRGEETGFYIIDPTFRQFSYFSERRDLTVSNTPAFRLAATNGHMHDQLLNKGFAALTQESAADYLRCFQKFDPDFAPIDGAYDWILEETGLRL